MELRELAFPALRKGSRRHVEEESALKIRVISRNVVHGCECFLSIDKMIK